MFEQTMVIGLLALCSFQDLKTQKIRINPILIAGIIGLICHMMNPRLELINILMGMGVGAAVCLLSIFTKGKIGMGDAILLVVTGIFLGMEQNLELFFTALFWAGLWGLYLMVVKKHARSDSFPFVPFLLVSYVEMLVLGL